MPRPAMISARPPEMRSTVANSSKTRTGSAVVRMRDRARQADRGLGITPSRDRRQPTTGVAETAISTAAMRCSPTAKKHPTRPTDASASLDACRRERSHPPQTLPWAPATRLARLRLPAWEASPNAIEAPNSKMPHIHPPIAAPSSCPDRMIFDLARAWGDRKPLGAITWSTIRGAGRRQPILGSPMRRKVERAKMWLSPLDQIDASVTPGLPMCGLTKIALGTRFRASLTPYAHITGCNSIRGAGG